jgi:hypothetical protein
MDSQDGCSLLPPEAGAPQLPTHLQNQTSLPRSWAVLVREGPLQIAELSVPVESQFTARREAFKSVLPKTFKTFEKHSSLSSPRRKAFIYLFFFFLAITESLICIINVSRFF